MMTSPHSDSAVDDWASVSLLSSHMLNKTNGMQQTFECVRVVCGVGASGVGIFTRSQSGSTQLMQRLEEENVMEEVNCSLLLLSSFPPPTPRILSS